MAAPARADAAAGGLGRLDGAVRKDIAVCVVEFGGNDRRLGFPPSLTRDSLAAIVRRLKARGVAVVLVGQGAGERGEAYAQVAAASGQVERMNRTLKEATVRRYHYENHQQLQDHLAAFLDAYNFAKRMKTLRRLTPYEAICKAWAETPKRFIRDPVHLTSGLNA